MKRIILTLSMAAALFAHGQKAIEDNDNAKEFWENLSDATPLDGGTKTLLQALIDVPSTGDVAADIAAAEAAAEGVAAADATAKVAALEGSLGTAATQDTGTTSGTIPLLGANGALPIAQGGTGSTALYSSPSIYIGTNQNAFYIAHKDDLDADASTFITSNAITGTQALIVDDVVRMLKGSASSTSLRASTWTTLSANRWTNIKGLYLFSSDYGSGTTLRDLRGSNNLTIAGSPTRNSTGMTLDGIDDKLTAAGPLLTSGSWSALYVGTITSSSRTLASRSTEAENFRTSFISSNASGFSASFKRVDPTSTSHSSGLTSTVRRGILNIQDATNLRTFAAGSETAVASTALTATTVSSTTFQIGSPFGAGSFAPAVMEVMIIWNSDVSTDYSEIYANLNALLGLGL